MATPGGVQHQAGVLEPPAGVAGEPVSGPAPTDECWLDTTDRTVHRPLSAWLVGHTEAQRSNAGVPVPTFNFLHPDTVTVCPVCYPPEPERLGREGDSQPMPVPNDSPFIQDLVVADVQARRALGVKRYGTPLQAHNGRDALQDAYEEALDLCTYLKQAIVERDAPCSGYEGNWPYERCRRCGGDALAAPHARGIHYVPPN